MPRPPERIPEVLALLEEVWTLPRNSDQRLGQLLLNLMRRHTTDMSLEDVERALWNAEDVRFADILRAELRDP